jgi:hypothetical protein
LADFTTTTCGFRFSVHTATWSPTCGSSKSIASSNSSPPAKHPEEMRE